jgi:pyruvate-formate lyase-activating enzyme
MFNYHFANILFSGPCNQRCPCCIGRQIDPALNRDNLAVFPLHNQREFVALLDQYNIRQVTLTGTNTDPQLYRHQVRLINSLHEAIPGVQISLHTNGQRALVKMDVFNLYDRVTISVPSFDPHTFFKMTGVRTMPDLDAILCRARIPVKISCVLGQDNVDQVPAFLAQCRRLGIRRVAFREQFGNPIPWQPPSTLKRVGTFHNNPVYDDGGIQVTYWNFDRATTSSLNLFADGSISTAYLLARHTPRHNTLKRASYVHLPLHNSFTIP